LIHFYKSFQKKKNAWTSFKLILLDSLLQEFSEEEKCVD